MPTTRQTKTERIEIRVSPPVKALLLEAAGAAHKNASEFVLDAALDAANRELADRRLFRLDKDRWAAFQEALDRPVREKSRLRKLLNEPGVLD